MSIQAFRYEGAALVPCEHTGPRMLLRRVALATSLDAAMLTDEVLGGNLVAHPRGLAVVYLPLAECATGDEELAERHLEALRVALGLGS